MHTLKALSIIAAVAVAGLTVRASVAQQAAPPAAPAAAAHDMECCKGAAAAGMLCGICDPNAKAEVGKQAVNFSLKDADGKEHMLSEYKDKLVVLTWAEEGCPVYAGIAKAGAFAKLQDEFKDATFIYINSNEGVKPAMLAPIAKINAASADAKNGLVLMDPSGAVGKQYDAKTTPHCYVIGKDGKVAYNGAIDNAQAEDKATPVNYVQAALASLQKGEAVKVQSTKPYGCAVRLPEAKAAAPQS